MASGPGVTKARAVLDMLLSGGAKMRMWTVAPGFDGTGGTETVPGGGVPTVSWSPAVAGSGGQIAKAASSTSTVLANMAVASTAIAAVSYHDPADDSLIALDNSPTLPLSWAVGESPMFPAGSLVIPFVPVA